jgi:hypothetical protein
MAAFSPAICRRMLAARQRSANSALYAFRCAVGTYCASVAASCQVSRYVRCQVSRYVRCQVSA